MWLVVRGFSLFLFRGGDGTRGLTHAKHILYPPSCTLSLDLMVKVTSGAWSFSLPTSWRKDGSIDSRNPLTRHGGDKQLLPVLRNACMEDGCMDGCVQACMDR